ncbi:hypothetical protein E2562_038110 [Oryza meyeriana var. granulata]|uniref:Uncharacterized protein n=1 Tax=Oryza meyeriana var. granulata TaxID=110450 RepID=A0A6G1EU67_9ORYZ|nr:hypothetical protein E2562_038110 [Oryza meyeriana var. granulata]
MVNQEFTESALNGHTSLALISNLEVAIGAMKLEPSVEASTSTNEGGLKVQRRRKGKKKRIMNKPYGQQDQRCHPQMWHLWTLV